VLNSQRHRVVLTIHFTLFPDSWANRPVFVMPPTITNARGRELQDYSASLACRSNLDSALAPQNQLSAMPAFISRFWWRKGFLSDVSKNDLAFEWSVQARRIREDEEQDFGSQWPVSCVTG
jgi:hypothetical protein